MPWYKTGTVSVTLNSNAVTGTGTAFIVNCRVGDAFRGPDGRWYEVTNVASNTAMSIDPPYIGATASGGSYALAPMQGYVKDSADALRAIVNTYGAQLAALKTTGNYDILPVSKGGTGGATQADARIGLGLGSVATDNVVPVARGGTGGTTQATARAGINALGVGEYGVGQTGAVVITDLDATTLATGMYRFQSPVGGVRALPAGTYSIWVNRLNTASSTTQVAINYVTNRIYTRGETTADFIEQSSIGVGQTWQDVTSSRALGTTYTNTTGRPIQIAGVVGPTSSAVTTPIITIGSTNVYGNYSGVASNYVAFANIIIPPGANYSVAPANGTAALVNWRELR